MLERRLMERVGRRVWMWGNRECRGKGEKGGWWRGNE